MRLLLFATLLAVVLVLAGCGGQQQEYIDVNYFEGPDGVVMKLVDNSPPEKVYPEQMIPITVLFDNEGAFSFNSEFDGEVGGVSGYASVIFDPLYFEEAEQSLTYLAETRDALSFAGKSVNWPGGEERYVTLAMLEAKPLAGRTGADSTVVVSWCYPYETRLTQQVCVDKDPTLVDEYSLCEAQDMAFTDQGAPVAVTNVVFESVPMGTREVQVTSQEPLLDPSGYLVGTQTVTRTELITAIKPVVRLIIQNVGDGSIVRGRPFGSQMRCNEGREDFPAGSVLISAKLGNRDLLCTPSIPVFYDGQIEVMCALDDEDLVVASNYFDILQIRLSYMYQSKVSKTVMIDDSAKQYQSLSLENLECNDFNGRYQQCLSFTQRAVGVEGTSLDCYYCDETEKCLDSQTACTTDCKKANLIDERTRRCVEPCPDADAVISKSSFKQNTATVNLVCRNPSGVKLIDQHRCGCEGMKYMFTNDTTRCVDKGNYLPGGDEYLGGEVYTNGNGIQAGISVPTNVMSRMIAGERWYICAYGKTFDNDISKMKQFPLTADKE